jgi:hypothetical protein
MKSPCSAVIVVAALTAAAPAQPSSVAAPSDAQQAEVRVIGDPTFPLIQTPSRFKPRRQANVRSFGNQAQDLTLFEATGPGCVRHFWMTNSTSGRGLRIRIHADQSPQPQVDMELNHFFGVLLGKDPYLVESPGVKVLPHNAYNCYLPIPFSTSCRISLRIDKPQGKVALRPPRFEKSNPERVSIYYQTDWQQYESADHLTPYRLHAVFREENPAVPWGSYSVADLEGRGFVAGIFKAIRRLDRSDLIYHTGGSTWLIDGEIEPHAYSGINEEDDFNFSYGLYRHQSKWVGAPFVDREGADTDELVAWRFFGPDPVPFQSSLQLAFGSRADYLQSVLYYYRIPGSKAPQVITPTEWEVHAPFRCRNFDDFTREETADEISKAPFHKTVASSRGWVDVRSQLGRDRSVGRAPSGISIYARSTIASDGDKTAALRLAFDDWLTLWVNDRQVTTVRHDKGFEIARVPVTLKKGANTIRIKHNNRKTNPTTSYMLWAFHCAVEP